MPQGIKGFQKGNTFGKTSFKTRRSYKGVENPFFGKKHTSKVKQKLREFRWDDIKEDAKYGSIHEYVRKRLPKPLCCPKCGSTKRRLELSNTGHTYKRDLRDWEWLCSKCHFEKDGRIKHLKQWKKKYNNLSHNIQE